MFYRPSQSQSHRLLIIHQVSKKPEKILSLSQEATTEFKYPAGYIINPIYRCKMIGPAPQMFGTILAIFRKGSIQSNDSK